MSISRKPLSKAEKSLIFVCLFAVLPLAGVVYMAGGRDADPKWDIAPAAVRPTPNGYDFYVAAAKATVRFTPEIDAASDTAPGDHSPGSPYALKNYSVARRTQWLKANTKTFDLVGKGLATPSMAPDNALAMNTDWSKLRQLARDMGVRSRTFQLQKQPMRATMAALDTMQMGQDTTRGGGLLARLVGIAIVALGRAPLDDWNKTVDALNADEARRAARRLESIIAHGSTMEQALIASKRDTLQELQNVFATPDWRRTFPSEEASGLRQKLSKVWQTQTTSKQKIYDNLNRALDTQIASTKLPYSQARKVTLPADLDIFTPSFTVPGNRMLLNEARNTTSNDMLLMRLALRAYIAEHGGAPLTLSALVPGYLKRVPTDVYNDGKPLFYKPQGKTYRLWSVGPDGINNGGVPLARKPGAKTLAPASNLLDNTGDFVAGLCR